MVTIKGTKIQFTFMIDPEDYDRVKDFRFEERLSSSGEITRQAIRFYFDELNHRNPRHPILLHRMSTRAGKRQ